MRTRGRVDLKAILVILVIGSMIATISLPGFKPTVSVNTTPKYHGPKTRPSMMAIQMPGEKPVAPRR